MKKQDLTRTQFIAYKIMIGIIYAIIGRFSLRIPIIGRAEEDAPTGADKALEDEAVKELIGMVEMRKHMSDQSNILAFETGACIKQCENCVAWLEAQNNKGETSLAQAVHVLWTAWFRQVPGKSRRPVSTAAAYGATQQPLPAPEDPVVSPGRKEPRSPGHGVGFIMDEGGDFHIAT